MLTNKEAYKQFTAEAIDLPIFMLPWFLDGATNETETWDVLLYKVEEKVIGTFLYIYKQKLGLRYYTQPSFVKHSGPYIIPTYRDELTTLKAFEYFCEQLPHAVIFRQSFHPLIKDFHVFNKYGYRQTSKYTFRLEIGDLDQVWKGINRNIKRNVNKADQQMHLTTSEDAPSFYYINKMSFDRQGVKMVYSLDQFLKHDFSLKKHQARSILLAKNTAGEVYAAAYIIHYNGIAYYHLSGVHPDFLNTGSGIWILWQSIKYCNENLGINMLDFEGSMIKSIANIRTQFGAKAIPYFFTTKSNFLIRPLLRLGGKI